jgi:phosphoribosyl 1,2-cyclic phosphate phosphodiesterase
LGCDCAVCLSTDPRDKRLRTAALLQYGATTVAIDCGPDFRQQMLAAKVGHLDAIIMTHEHNDHIVGLDDVRPYNFKQMSDMPVYATPRVQEQFRQRFAYVFKEQNKYPGAPMVQLLTIDKETPFDIGDLHITPVEVMHGSLPILGFRVGNFAYLTDVRSITDQELEKLHGLDILVLNALHHSEHHSHLNLEQALALSVRIFPKKTYLIHMSHRMGLHEEIEQTLPANVFLGYDGLRLELDS